MRWRTLFFLLVFVNLLVYVWTHGYLGNGDEGREPQRLAQQLHPEAMHIVRAPAPATPATPGTAASAALACRAVGGLTAAEAVALARAAGAAGWQATAAQEAAPALHRILIADLANKAAAEKKAGELRQLGVTDFLIVALDGGRQEIRLGSFTGAAAAKEALAALNRKGVNSARIEVKETGPAQALVQLRAPAETLERGLAALIAPYAGAHTGDCLAAPATSPAAAP